MSRIPLNTDITPEGIRVSDRSGLKLAIITWNTEGSFWRIDDDSRYSDMALVILPNAEFISLEAAEYMVLALEIELQARGG